MEKERKITAPEGREIEKVEIVDGAAVVTFKEKERKLPKSWDEFCEMFPITEKEFYITDSEPPIRKRKIDDDTKRDKKLDLNCLPNRATAKAVLALCQLIQLRNAFNGDWVPDWTDGKSKFVIHLDQGEFKKYDWHGVASSFLYFKNAVLRDEFLRCFRPLIEKLKPLYGIKENGNQ